ncbi:unnamed protein product [Cladocopium goreaui]|uniref:UspA domain-containing protein n=1 Tax=Cladocopium goreaui TaxID=2562237 RepID=A0A9P1BV94_9DINO|nr:unnamed protein product [Cladocopium goreaui]
MDRPMDREDTVTHLENQAWIDCEKIDELLQDHVKVIVSVDGSDQSSCAFEWALHGFAQSDRETDLLIVHYYDNTKEYLPPKWRKGAIHSDVEAKCTSYLVSKRYAISVKERTPGVKIGQLLCQDIKEQNAGFCVMGFAGRKGKDRHLIGSNVLEVMRCGKCSCIVFKESDPSKLPLSRPAKFVVSTGLNPAATKAFYDALRLSRPGDEIHVVYIRPYLEPHSKESKVTTAIRHKYDSIFEGMKDPAAWPSGKMVKFGDRNVKLVFAPQGINEGVAQALVRYANNFEADFVMVGTNVLRVDRGKPPVGSVSLQIVMEFPGNCVVSSFNPDFVAQPGYGRQTEVLRVALRGGQALSLKRKVCIGHDARLLKLSNPAGGDRMLLEGDYLHIEVDLRGLYLPFGTMAVSINSEPQEVIFDDITLTNGSPLMPVVCMGGNLSRVRLMPVS